MLKISIITVVFNNATHIEGALKSVLNQDYPQIEYIVIDGGSTDGTGDIISRYLNRIHRYVSEPDQGIYDAMNKGIELASGDLVGFLNSDDLYFDNGVLARVAAACENTGSDICYGDLVYVSMDLKRILRHWKSGDYRPGAFNRAWVPPHPACFVRKRLLDTHGKFNTSLSISADFELLLRLFEIGNAKSCYIPEIMVKMRIGGESIKNVRNIMKGNREKYRAFKMNNLKVSPLFFLYNLYRKFRQIRVSDGNI